MEKMKFARIFGITVFWNSAAVRCFFMVGWGEACAHGPSVEFTCSIAIW